MIFKYLLRCSEITIYSLTTGETRFFLPISSQANNVFDIKQEANNLQWNVSIARLPPVTNQLAWKRLNRVKLPAIFIIGFFKSILLIDDAQRVIIGQIRFSSWVFRRFYPQFQFGRRKFTYLESNASFDLFVERSNSSLQMKSERQNPFEFPFFSISQTEIDEFSELFWSHEFTQVHWILKSFAWSFSTNYLLK